MTLKDYEDEVLFRMFDKKIIGHGYTRVEHLASKINWIEIQQTHGVNKKLKRVVRRLSNKGYVDFHGKSGDAASLTALGVAYVKGKLLTKDIV